jgi:hypothetical protein
MLCSGKGKPNLKDPFKRRGLNQWTLPEYRHNKLPKCGVLRINKISKVQDVKFMAQFHKKKKTLNNELISFANNLPRPHNYINNLFKTVLLVSQL